MLAGGRFIRPADKIGAFGGLSSVIVGATRCHLPHFSVSLILIRAMRGYAIHCFEDIADIDDESIWVGNRKTYPPEQVLGTAGVSGLRHCRGLPQARLRASCLHTSQVELPSGTGSKRSSPVPSLLNLHLSLRPSRTVNNDHIIDF